MDWLNRLATPAIAVAGIAIAGAQLWIANIRLKHDLFERRYAVYAAARKFVQQVCQKRTITIDELSSFHYAGSDAIFVCGQGVTDYLEKLRTNAIRAAELYDKIGSHNASQAEIQEHWDLLNWLSNQIDVLTGKFKPFLRLWPRGINIFVFGALTFALLATTAGAEGRRSPPTATEIFHLRSECAALGQKMLQAEPPFPGYANWQLSHYDPQSNRCYVEITVVNSDEPRNYISRFLFDGQTGELLATANSFKGYRAEEVYDRNHKQTEFGWDDASQYIDAMMADDRLQ